MLKLRGDDYKHMRERVKSSAGARASSGTYYGFFKPTVVQGKGIF